MSSTSISIQTPDRPENTAILDAVHNALDRIRARAYELFEERGGWPHAELEDWFRAEQDLFQCPDCRLHESSGSFTVEMSAPGFSANQLGVALEDGFVNVHGRSETQSQTEYQSQELFRRFGLPEGVDQERIQASLSNGTLKITMPKLGAATEPLPAAKEPKKAEALKVKAAAASAA